MRGKDDEWLGESDLADSVVAKLRLLGPELRRDGIVQLSLFGSVARGEARAGSDVDLAVLFDKAAGVGLIELAGLELRLGEILGRPVDLTTLPIRNPWVRAAVERDAQRIF